MINKSLKKYVPKALVNVFRLVYDKISPIIYFLNRKVALHNYAGFLLRIYIFNSVSKDWYDHDWCRNEIGFLRQYKLKAGAHVFDIGAHHGVVALIFAKIVGRKGKVIAVEMDAGHVRIANLNKQNNNAPNLQIFHAAVGEKDGSIFFHHDQIVTEAKDKSASKIRSISVDSLTQIYGSPSVLYIDVEGYECSVLKGAKRTLRLYPDWCIEVHVKNGLEDFNCSVKKLISYFPRDKYRLYMATATDKCNIEPFNFNSRVIENRFYLIAINN